MNLIARLKNLWKLGELETSKLEDGRIHIDYIKPELKKDTSYKYEDKPRMAQIIKMKSVKQIAQELLEYK